MTFRSPVSPGEKGDIGWRRGTRLICQTPDGPRACSYFKKVRNSDVYVEVMMIDDGGFHKVTRSSLSEPK